jgi:hypothetical protein
MLSRSTTSTFPSKLERPNHRFERRGHQSTALCHIGNISYRLGQPSSLAALERVLGQLSGRDMVVETLERTRRHLGENRIDL